MFRLVASLFSITLLAGCAAEATYKASEESFAWKKKLPLSNAEYGKPPSNVALILKDHFSKSLKDPDSARYGETTQPVNGFAVTNLSARRVVYGYVVCTKVNAKNSFGGYTGNHTFWLLIRDDKVVYDVDMSTDDLLKNFYVNDLASVQLTAHDNEVVRSDLSSQRDGS